MNTTDWINIFGYAASLCMVMGYLPQAIHTIRTRETDAIALPTFLLLGLGSIFFIVNGVLTNNIPLVITNAITTLASAIIFVIKVRNDLKKRNITRK